MRPYISAALFYFALSNLIADTGPVVGYLFYRSQSWHKDSQASVVEVTEYQQFPTLMRVTTADGRKLEVLPGQSPLFVPSSENLDFAIADAERIVETAEVRYPQQKELLVQIQEAWRQADAQKSLKLAAAKEVAQKQAKEKAVEAGGFTFITKKGQEYIGASITRIDDKGISVIFSSGIGTVPFEDLPDDLVGFPESVKADILNQLAEEEPVVDSRQSPALETASNPVVASFDTASIEEVPTLEHALNRFNRCGREFIHAGTSTGNHAITRVINGQVFAARFQIDERSGEWVIIVPGPSKGLHKLNNNYDAENSFRDWIAFYRSIVCEVTEFPFEHVVTIVQEMTNKTVVDVSGWRFFRMPNDNPDHSGDGFAFTPLSFFTDD